MTANVVAAPPSAPGIENQSPSLPAFRENRNVHIVCPDCKIFPPDLVEDNADLICANCGRVLEERIISSESEWRTFNNDEKGGEDPNRVGDAENELLHGNQGTTIGGGGPNISKQTRSLKKAQALQNEDKHNRNLQAGYTQLDDWAEKEHMTQAVKSTAKGMYKQVYDGQAFRGKSTTAVLASCLFIACRSNRTPRSFAEIMNLTKIPKKDIGRTFKQLEKYFEEQNLKKEKQIEEDGGTVNKEANGFQATSSAKPSILVGRFCAMLGMPFRVQAVAVKLAEKISGYSALAGRSPLSTAGACMYFASHLLGDPKNLSDISQVANVSDATIKQAYKHLYASKEELLEKDWLGPQPTAHSDRNKQTLFGDLKNLPKVSQAP